jgi:hypothetical protein
MKVPEQPGKSSRSAPEMLEEILSLVRSIDKATSHAPFIGLTSHTYYPQIAASHEIIQVFSRGSRNPVVFHRHSEKWYLTWKDEPEAEKTVEFTEEASARSRLEQLKLGA